MQMHVSFMPFGTDLFSAESEDRATTVNQICPFSPTEESQRPPAPQEARPLQVAIVKSQADPILTAIRYNLYSFARGAIFILL